MMYLMAGQEETLRSVLSAFKTDKFESGQREFKAESSRMGRKVTREGKGKRNKSRNWSVR